MTCCVCSGRPFFSIALRARWRALDGRDRGVQGFGGFSRAEPEDVAEDQRRALGRRQVLKSDDEGELHGLALGVSGLGGGHVLEPEARVGVGLDPDRLGQRLANPGVGIARRAVVERKDALGAFCRDVDAGVGRDPVEPAAKRASPFEARQPPPGTQHRVLQGVLGVVERAEHAVAVRVKLGAMRLDEAAIGRLVAAARPL